MNYGKKLCLLKFESCSYIKTENSLFINREIPSELRKSCSYKKNSVVGAGIETGY